MAPRLLLLSNSTNPGEEFLGYPRPHIAEFLGAIRRVVFIPFAGVTITWDEYANRVAEALGAIHLAIVPIHHEPDPIATIENAEAVMIGGGNTFHLLYHLYQYGLVEPIRRRVRDGMPYIGWSAGSNVACPTIRTTNDMPILEPPTLDALAFIPFQLNPHYTDYVIPNLRAETRDDRLKEFCIANPGTYVVGLREGTMLRREGDELRVVGSQAMKIFRSGDDPFELPPSADLGFLFESASPAGAR